jgi:hypothetical protein
MHIFRQAGTVVNDDLPYHTRQCQAHSRDHNASWTPAQPAAFAVCTHIQSDDIYRRSTNNEISLRLAPEA